MPEQFSRILERAIDVIEQENDSLRNRQSLPLPDYHARKCIVLYELSQLGPDRVPKTSVTVDALRRLQASLTENQSLLALNIAAVREIADAMNESRIGAESDGTYSACPRTGPERA